MADYNQLFSKLKPLAPRKELNDLVLSRLYIERRKIALHRAYTLLATSFSGASALIYFGRVLWLEIYQSGFAQLSSLLFSDAGLVVQYWQEYSLSLLETLPALSTAVVLALILAILISFKSFIRNLSTFRTQQSHTI